MLMTCAGHTGFAYMQPRFMQSFPNIVIYHFVRVCGITSFVFRSSFIVNLEIQLTNSL
jgi:hypothetical protein